MVVTLNVHCEVHEVVDVFVGVVHVEVWVPFSPHGEIDPLHVPVGPAGGGGVVYFAGVKFESFEFVFYEEAWGLWDLYPGVVS